MAKLATYFRARPQISQQDVPAHRMLRVMQSLKRRLSDQVEEVFYRAIAEKDGRTATGLYALLEDMNTRLKQRHGRERRISDQLLVRAREALSGCESLDPLDDRTLPGSDPRATPKD